MIELGSSDAAVVMGCSPFKTPWVRWAELVGLIPEEDHESEIMSMGTALQDTVLREFALRERWVVEKDQPTYHHKTKPYLRATPDGLLMQYIRGEDRTSLALVETKCLVSHVPDVPRVDHVIQCVHQRAVAETVEEGIESQFLVYFGGLRMVYFEIPRHQGAIDRILREEEKFLDLVAREIPPPVSARDASVLNKAWPWAEAKSVDLPDTLLVCDRVIEQAERHIEGWQVMRDEAEAKIKAALGDATEGTLTSGTRFTWKTGPRKGYVVQPSRVRPFKRHGRKLEELMDDVEDMMKRHRPPGAPPDPAA